MHLPEYDGFLVDPIIFMRVLTPNRLEDPHRCSSHPVWTKTHMVRMCGCSVLKNHLSLTITSWQVLQVLQFIYCCIASSRKQTNVIIIMIYISEPILQKYKDDTKHFNHKPEKRFQMAKGPKNTFGFF